MNNKAAKHQPTPAEIAAATAAIRGEWDEVQERKRRGSQTREWTVPGFSRASMTLIPARWHGRFEEQD